MKLMDIYKQLNESDREKGAPLSSQTWRSSVNVYRAVEQGVTDFNSMDYVTLSRKFAVEHAENNAVVYETPYDVIMAVISTDEIFDAYNPGEYFYDGAGVTGKVIYTSKGYEYEGWEELTKDDFTDRRHDDRIR